MPEAKPMVIGFVGRAGAGKDTAADVIESCNPGKMLRMSFAKPLKDICTMAFMLEPDALIDRVKKETVDPRWNMTPRQMCQRLGTDFFRKLDENFWIKRVRHEFETIDDPNKIVVFTDVRFLNEALFIKNELQGKLYYIDSDFRLGYVNSIVNVHESELQVYDIKSHVDEIIYNNHSIEEFEKQVGRLQTW